MVLIATFYANTDFLKNVVFFYFNKLKGPKGGLLQPKQYTAAGDMCLRRVSKNSVH